MRIVLLVSNDCTPCHAAERLWSALCTEMNLTLQIVGTEQHEGSALAHRLNVNSVPALIIDDRVVSVGVPAIEAARTLLATQIPRA